MRAEIEFNIVGFDDMEGLWCKKTNTARGPMAHESVPYRIFVTAGPSCYDIEKGLKIHKTELFEDFYRQLYKSPVAVTLHDATLSIEGGTHCPYSSFGVDIQLMRTLRLPDDAEAHDLPAGLGPLPLINSLLHLTTLPPSIREKGGILVPMLQREAMWILFRSKDPCTAVRIINILSTRSECSPAASMRFLEELGLQTMAAKPSKLRLRITS